MTEPATRLSPAPTAIDLLCLRCLGESQLMARSEVVAVRAWWEQERRAGESLPQFLQRCGIFHRKALGEFELIAQGYAKFSIISHLFTPHGFALLRKRAAAAPDHAPLESAGKSTLDTTPSLNASDTVCNDEIEAPKLPPTVPVAALPILRRDGVVAEVMPAAEAMIGKLVGGCRLARLIGRGARSLVFEAEESASRRPTAIKILAPEMVRRTPVWKERFLHEAKTASRLDHSLLLKVHGHGEDGEFIYCTMPLMFAGSTREALRGQGPFSPYEATRIAVEVARALEVLHRRGIVHGNLKPSNVFVTPSGVVKVADASPPLPAAGRPHSTRATEVATDLRMLAATWHWLLTGRAPGPAASDASLPPPCTTALARALAPARGQAFRNATELAAALTAVALQLCGSTAEVPVPIARSIDAGQVLGKCLLTERVGQGASGVVFRARHLTLNVQVAVKVLASGGGARLAREFRTEARALAQLNHPNVVRVWDFDDDPEHPYLVLEFVEGVNLAELIKQSGRLRPDRAIAIVAQIAEGLAAAHRLGIVHRDVKPGNILIAHDGTAKLADLGIALIAGASSRDSAAGTIAYMAPEQAAGGKAIDFRADVYALGATLYHLVTGRVPFLGSTHAEVVAKHAGERPLPPHELAPDLDPALSAMILKMLAKSPADRCQSYADLILMFGTLDPAENGRGAVPPSATTRTPGQSESDSEVVLA